MCDALKEFFKEAHARGMAEGRKEGRAEGKREGREEGRAEGKREGREEGRREGERRNSELTARLLKEKRLEDLQRSTEDEKYREKLLKEYGIE